MPADLVNETPLINELIKRGITYKKELTDLGNMQSEIVNSQTIHQS